MGNQFLGVADSATRLSTERTIALTGDASGSILFDGSKNVGLPVKNTALSMLYSNETLISNGYASSGALYINYRGATKAITDYYMWNGLATSGGLANVRANIFYGSLSGNASTATSASKLTTARSITLTGNVTGTVNFDGSANVSMATKLAQYITLGVGDTGGILQNGSVYQQKLLIVDNSTSGDAVFSFQQSTNSGSSWTSLLTINDDGNIIANKFTGALAGNATSATNASQLGGVAASNYLQKSGGVLSGSTAKITRSGTSSSWYNGRTNAIIATTSAAAGIYPPLWSAKSYDGSWECGTYTSNKLYFTYITDTNFNSATNKATAQITFGIDGVVTALTFSGKLQGNADTATNSTQLGGVAAANYARRDADNLFGNHTNTQMALRARHLDGLGTDNSTNDTLYLNYSANKPIALGYRAGATISADGKTYSGTSNNANNLGGVAAAQYINTSDTLILRGTV